MLSVHVESRNRNAVLLAVLVLLSLAGTGCMTTNAKPAPRLFVPPPVQPQPLPTSAPVISEAAPALDLSSPAGLSASIQVGMPRLSPPPKPVVAPPRPAPVKTTPTPPAPPPPKIIQLFSAEQQREYSKAYDESQDRVRKALAILQTKNLTRDQRNTVDRIQTFQLQAEQEHERDLVTAVNLARRADALSADLLRRLH